MMKLALKSETVFEMFREMQGTEKYGSMEPKAPNPDASGIKYIPFHGANYLVYDEHKDAPPGFALRVGRPAAVFLVDKRVAGKKLKIPVGVGDWQKRRQKPISLTEARDQAWGLAQLAKKHGANPKGIADKVDAAELTFRQVWDDYIADLKARNTPIKPNSGDSLEKARNKLSDWENRKVRRITAQEVMERFNLHAVKNGHRTATQAMGRWAASAVKNAIETEYHNAFSEGRPPSLTYHPFTILQTKKIYRSGKQLERAYAAKGIRNPMSFESAAGPYVREAWKYRKENPVSADFILLTLLWGLRRGESATFQWRDRISDADAVYGRWIDMVDRMQRVEELILSRAPSVYNALRPKSLPRMQETEEVLVPVAASKASTRKPK